MALTQEVYRLSENWACCPGWGRGGGNLDIPDFHACLFAGTHRWGSGHGGIQLFSQTLTEAVRAGVAAASSPALYLADLGLGGALGSMGVLTRAVLPGQDHEQMNEGHVDWSKPASSLALLGSAVLPAPLQLPARPSAPPACSLFQPMSIPQSFQEIKLFLVLSADGVGLSAKYCFHC